MDFKDLDDKITSSGFYWFTMKHKKFITILEGILVIGLLIGINMYFYQDWQIKEQIRDNCGYTTNNWECVCSPEAVNAYKGEEVNISLDTDFNLGSQNDKLVR